MWECRINRHRLSISAIFAQFIVTPKYFDKFLIFIIFSTGWNPWGDWTSCSSSCGGGKQERRRTCNSKPGHMHHHTSTSKPCPSYNIEQRTCNSFDCKGKNLYPYYNCNKSCELVATWKTFQFCDIKTFIPLDIGLFEVLKIEIHQTAWM